MALNSSTNLISDVSGKSLREDLGDVIYDISPMDTVFMSKAGRGTAKSTLHEWLTDALTDATARNIAIEGDDFVSTNRTVPSRLKNYTQISTKNIHVSGSVRAVDNAGMRELLAYHTARAGKELKRDIEKACLSANFGTAGSSASGRVSAGVQNWCYLNNHIKLSIQLSSTTPIPSSGFAQEVTAGTSTTFIETDLKNMLTQAWSCGGETDVILAGPGLYNSISQFTGLATRFSDVKTRAQAQIVGSADVYVSFAGAHNIVVSRWAPTTVVFALDMNTWQIDYLRPFQTLDIAKIGDSDRRMLLVEWTLVAKAPTANTKATAAA